MNSTPEIVDVSRQTMTGIIRTHVIDFVKDNDFVVASVVVSSDGHLVAGAQKKEYSLDRLSAIGSTFMALGDSLAGEVAMGGCKDVIAELDGGIVAFMHVTRNVAIASVSDSSRSLGLLLSSTRGCIDSILRELKSLPKTKEEATN